MKTYNSIIVGAGPAGLTASIYLARKKIDFLLISEDIGGQAVTSGNIENFPGYKSISGAELISKIQKQAEKLGVKIFYEKIKAIKKNNSLFMVTTEEKIYFTKTVIITSGKFPKKLDIIGEEEFLGKGVAYCATCDAPNFKNVPVAVIGGGNSAMDSVLQLAKYTNQIYLIDITDQFIADALMQEKVEKLGFVKIMHNRKIITIKGKKIVSAVEVEDTKNKEKETINLGGIFVNIGWQPSTQFKIPVRLNNQGEIIIDKNCCTNIKGFFAAGDVTDILAKQAIVAAGEGAKAALSVYNFLMKN